MERLYIGISGLIGVGKTTISKKIAEKLNVPVFFEPTEKDNEYLKDFYADMKTNAFPMQIYLLQRRFTQQQQIIWSGKGGVQDRTIYEDSVFCKMLTKSGLIREKDYDTYMKLFVTMSNFMPKPNMIIHLDVTPEESLRRIRLRNRDCESTITLEYLKELKEAYDDFLDEISMIIPVIRVDWNEFRPVDEVVDKIAVEYRRIHDRVRV
jgi:deoxyadenosine kinase